MMPLTAPLDVVIDPVVAAKSSVLPTFRAMAPKARLLPAVVLLIVEAPELIIKPLKVWLAAVAGE